MSSDPQAPTPPESAPPASPQPGPAGHRCDFCGAIVPTVRRVALDVGYDRLQATQRELYACTPCSERKERARRGLER